jgi:hypothetical protein
VVDSQGNAIVTFNPEMMWTDQIFFANSVNTSTNIYTCGNGTTAANFVPVVPGVMQGGLPTTASTAYSGRSRFLGAEVTFQSTTTELNMGGSLFYTHAPYTQSLLKSVLSTSTTTVTTVDAAAVLSSTDITAFRTVGSGLFKAVILPHSTEFCDVESDTVGDLVGGTGADLFESNQKLQAYAPTSDFERARLSWNRALVYQPAEVIPAGQSAKCVIDVVCTYYINVQPCCSSGSVAPAPTATAGTELIQPGLPQPLAAGIVNNALNTIRLARTTNPDIAIKAPKDPPEHGPVREVVDTLIGVARPVATAVDAIVGAVGRFF